MTIFVSLPSIATFRANEGDVVDLLLTDRCKANDTCNLARLHGCSKSGM